MGLIYGKNDEKNRENETEAETEITKLKAIMNEQSERIQLLKSEVETFRNAYHNASNTSIDQSIIEEIMETKNKKDYEYLVFSGGGKKGISFAGAIEELHKLSIIYSDSNKFKLKGIAGASAGSIVASLLAVGYDPNELITELSSIDFARIANDGLGYIGEGLDFLEKWGMCPGNYIMELLGQLISKKKGNPDYSIEDLYNETGIKLVIVTTNTSYSRSEYLYPGNPITAYSKIPIRLAVRLSIGIPFLFEPYFYNDCYFADGGILDNYPIHVFDGEYPGDSKARLNLCTPNPKVLGIVLMTNNQQLNYEITNKQIFDGLYTYAISYISTFLIENERRLMIPSFWIRSIIIITPNYPITQFTVTSEEKTELITAGKKYTREFFEQ